MTNSHTIFPYNIITLLQTESTQTYLRELDKRESLEEYTVVYTARQTAGRGQGTHTWESEPDKNICFSLLLKPEFLTPTLQFRITRMLSLSVVDTIRKYVTGEVKIKWPNDIYIGDKKICGILSQAQIIGDKIAKIYSGIGINVNQTVFEFAPNPTSLALQTDKTFSLTDVLTDVLNSIYNRYEQLKTDSEEQSEEYLSLLLYRNQIKACVYNDKRITARILSVNEYGHIIFETESGEQCTSDMQNFHLII